MKFWKDYYYYYPGQFRVILHTHTHTHTRTYTCVCVFERTTRNIFAFIDVELCYGENFSLTLNRKTKMNYEKKKLSIIDSLTPKHLGPHSLATTKAVVVG